jgi:hypothetical protein
MATTTTTDRTFAAFSKTAVPPRMKGPPDGGMCLSVFLVISKAGEQGKVLMGKINQDANWSHIGALDPERAARFGGGWMLPSSHLVVYEAPGDGARRVLVEQLDPHARTDLEGPVTFADATGEEGKKHWDIGFVYTGEMAALPNSAAWRELAFVDVDKVKEEDVVRSHLDVVRYAGKLKNIT